MRNTSIWQYISSKTLIVWPYQYTFLHKNCIVTAYLNPIDKIYKIVKYKSNIQKSQNQKLLKNLQNYKSASKIVKFMSNMQESQNSKPKVIRTSQNYKSVKKIKFLKTCPPTILSSVRDSYIHP